MPTKPKIAIIIGSTRPTRFADKPAQWILKQVQARDDIDVEIVDLRDHPLPFFDEAASNAYAPSQSAEAVRWQKTVGRYDGYIFVVAEYNRSITGVLKNALDQSYVEWARKPFTAIAYGTAGGSRALEHLRGIHACSRSYRRQRLLHCLLDGGQQADRRDRSQPPAVGEDCAGRAGLVGEGHDGCEGFGSLTSARQSRGVSRPAPVFSSRGGARP